MTVQEQGAIPAGGVDLTEDGMSLGVAPTSITLDSSANVTIKAKRNVTVEAGANLKLGAKMNATMEGLQVSHKAKTKFAA